MVWIDWRWCIPIGCFLAALAVAAPAVAVTEQQIEWCSRKGNPTFEQRLSACTAAIQSGRWSGKSLAWVYSNLCDMYLLKGEHDRAISECKRAIQLDPDHPDAHYNLGTAYLGKGEHANAIASFGQAIRVNPNDAQAFNNRGLIYDRMGDRDRAIADYRKACTLGEAQGCDNLRKLGVTP